MNKLFKVLLAVIVGVALPGDSPLSSSKQKIRQNHLENSQTPLVSTLPKKLLKEF